MKLAAIFNFAGSLFPYIFPDKEFKPRRLAAVVILVALSAFMYERYGDEGAANIIENTSEMIELTEQAK